MNCKICGRELDTDDPDSKDCGGDCAGCIRTIENEFNQITTWAQYDEVVAWLEAVPRAVDARVIDSLKFIGQEMRK